MAVRLTEAQVLKETGARLKRGSSRSSFEEICTDTRALTPGCLFVALVGERFDAHDFLAQAAKGGAAAAVIQQGRPLPDVPAGLGLYEVPDTLKALGQLAHGHRLRFQGPVGAVGGSNGKTTTKEMVGAILATRGPALKTEGNFNNEVGVPLTLVRLDPEVHVAAVVELGMNHAGEMTRLAAMAEPDAAVITVVQPEHLEGLGSLEGVAQAEGELFLGLRKDAVAVVNLDDPLIVAQARRARARQLTFGRAAGADVRLGAIALRGKEGLDVDLAFHGATHRVRLAFLGEHNAHNAAAAFAVGCALGYSPSECVQGLEAARPYARRLNVLEAPGGVTVIDDCYNANPASMKAALETLQGLARDGRPVAVLGDMLELGRDELAAHAQLGELAAGHAALVAFFGPRSKAAHDAAGRLAGRAAHFTQVEPLMAWLRPQLEARDVVLVKGSRGMKLERVVDALVGRATGSGH